MIVHPRFVILCRYADRHLEAGRRSRVASHLAGCSACRGTVLSIRELPDAVRAGTNGSPGPSLLHRILRDRRKGERVILPGEEQPPLPERGLPPWIWSVATAVGVAVLVFVGRPSAVTNLSEDPTLVSSLIAVAPPGDSLRLEDLPLLVR